MAGLYRIAKACVRGRLVVLLEWVLVTVALAL